MLKSNSPISQNSFFKPPLLPGLTKSNLINQPPLLKATLTPRIRRNQNSQSVHDHVVQATALHNHNKGKYVLAAHIDWIHGSPEEKEGIIPDITVADSTGITTIEVETIDSFLLGHSISQYRALNRIGNALVILAVPYGFDPDKLNEMKSQFYKLNLRNVALTETYY